MGFSPDHCEECGNPGDEYFEDGALTVCQNCVRLEAKALTAGVVDLVPHRRYSGQTNRDRNSQLRDGYLEDVGCVCGEYQPHYLKFYRPTGEVDGTVSALVHDGASVERLQEAMEACQPLCQQCRPSK